MPLLYGSGKSMGRENDMKPHIRKLLLHEGLKSKYIGFYRLGLLLELCPLDGSRIPLMGLYRQVGARRA